MAHPVVEAFRNEWPAAFAGPLLDKLSGNAFRWSTTQNRRSRKEIPPEVFVEGRPTIVLRDKFLDWLDLWLTSVSEARCQSSEPPRRKRRQGRTESAQTGTDVAIREAEIATERRSPLAGPMMPPRRRRRRDRGDDALSV